MRCLMLSLLLLMMSVVLNKPFRRHASDVPRCRHCHAYVSSICEHSVVRFDEFSN